MNKPYISCYMMTSIDGRIDCEMTGKLPGVEEYYPLLAELNFDAVISGRVTAELEIAEKGKFINEKFTCLDNGTFSNKADSSKKFEVIVDTKGTLLWKNNNEYDKNILIITSEQVSKEYLEYLDKKNISYIVAGKETIDLARAMEILKDTFNVEKVGVVGGPTINTAFLDAGLLDEIIILIGAGIDGRASYPVVFYSENDNRPLLPMELVEVKQYNSGAVLIKYKTK